MSHVKYEIDLWFEFNNFNKKEYEDFLDPEKVGTFKEAKESYFNYLQAKGRGEDVKSPFTFGSLKNPEFFFDLYKDNEFLANNVNLAWSDNIKVNSEFLLSLDGVEQKDNHYSKILHNIYKTIQSEANIDKLKGSMDLDFYTDIVKNQEKFISGLSGSISVGYCDLNFFLNKEKPTGYVEITNIDYPEMNLIVDFEYNPLMSIKGNTNIKEAISTAYKAYIEDKEPEEIIAENNQKRENGNYYEEILSLIRIEDPITGAVRSLNPEDFDNYNRSPLIEPTLEIYYSFKSKDKNLTNYYRYCNPDKISFKEFKDMGGIPLGLLNKNTVDFARKNMFDIETKNICLDKNLHVDFYYNCRDMKLIGEKNALKLFDALIYSGQFSIKQKVDVSASIKQTFDEDFEAFNLQDYGNEIGGSFIFRNIEYEFEYNVQTGELNLARYDYLVEDPETGYYKQVDLPAFLNNSAIQEMLADQLDFHCTKFIAENRYGSLDEMVKAAEIKASKSISSHELEKELEM